MSHTEHICNILFFNILKAVLKESFFSGGSWRRSLQYLSTFHQRLQTSSPSFLWRTHAKGWAEGRMMRTSLNAILSSRLIYFITLQWKSFMNKIWTKILICLCGIKLYEPQNDQMCPSFSPSKGQLKVSFVLRYHQESLSLKSDSFVSNLLSFTLLYGLPYTFLLSFIHKFWLSYK